jgi:hypothetical protein
VADPLAEAAALVAQLQQHAPGRLQTQLWAAEVQLRRGKLLLALSGVQRARAIGGEGEAGAHRATVRWCQAAAAQPPQQPTVKKVRLALGRPFLLAPLLPDGRACRRCQQCQGPGLQLLGPAAGPAAGTDPCLRPFPAPQLVDEALQQLLADAPLQQFAQRYVQQHGGASLPQLAAGVEMVAAVDPPAAAAAVQQLLANGLALGRPSHEECVEVHAMLQVRGRRGGPGGGGSSWRPPLLG